MIFFFFVKFPVLSLASTAINEALKLKAKAENSVSEYKAKAKAFKAGLEAKASLEDYNTVIYSPLLVYFYNK